MLSSTWRTVVDTMRILHDWMTLCFKSMWVIYWSYSGSKKLLSFWFGCTSSGHAQRPISRFQSSNISVTSFPGVFSEMPVWMRLFEVVFWSFYTLLWWQEAQQMQIVENGTHTEGANGSVDDPTVNPLSLFFPSCNHESPLACSIQPSQPLISPPWIHPYSLNLRVLFPWCSNTQLSCPFHTFNSSILTHILNLYKGFSLFYRIFMSTEVFFCEICTLIIDWI